MQLRQDWISQLLVQNLKSTGSPALSILRRVLMWMDCAMALIGLAHVVGLGGYQEKVSEFFQHLAGGEARYGVAPVGGQLCHGAQEEIPVGKMAMGNLQGGGVDDKVVDGDDVDIHQAVDVAALLVTVRRAAQAALDVVDAV